MTMEKKNDFKTSLQNACSSLKYKLPIDVVDWVKDMQMDVVNYHKHTDWSNIRQVDCATTIPEFFEKTRERHGSMYFSGEHGWQGEWLYCYDLCKQSENTDYPLKFRYSTEAYWVKDRHETDGSNCHIVLVARNYTGLRKLNYILSEASVDGFYRQPRIDLDLLFQLSPDEVYVTSACLAGWKYDDSESLWLQIWQHFGDSFFLEYQAHHTERQVELNKIIRRMHRQHGIQTIVGLDTHVLDDISNQKRDNILLRKNIHYDDEAGWFIDYPSGIELFQRFRDQGVLSDEEILYSMLNTYVFVNGCEEIELDTEFKIPIPNKYKQYDYSQRVKLLQQVINEQYKKEECKNKDRIDGIRYEVGQVVDSGVADYFLTNYEIMKLATSPEYGGQLTTTSRGSAASFYTSKLLGFTTLDRFDAEVPLYPERFITKERIVDGKSMPDIDMNLAVQDPFDKASRDLLGEHSCYPLLAVGKLGEKSGWKLYAGINDVEPETANEISKLIDKYNEAKKQADDEDKDSILIEDYIKDKHLLDLFNKSREYQDIVDNGRIHACGRLCFNGDHKNEDIVGYGDIRYEIGLTRVTSKSGSSYIVACVEGSLLDAYGYCKDDFLIVDVVGIIYKLYHAIGKEVPTVSELRRMVADDSETWKMYAIGATCCLNQCEKQATTKRVMQYKPTNVRELAAFIAAIRPGFKSLLNQFLARKPYSCGEKKIDNLLDDSAHYMLFQESIMKVLGFLGLEMGETYKVIKSISKKKLVGEKKEKLLTELQESWKNEFGNVNNFQNVWNVISDAARYSFNSSHALAMACDSLYEAWMKAHHRSVFYEVTLNHYQDKDDKDKVAALTYEACNLFGYKMGKYEYGADNSKFTVDDDTKTIYPNLASVKGIGEKAVLHMIEVSKRGYSNIVDIYLSIKGSPVNATVFRNLVKIGYFKKFGSTKQIMKQLDIIDYWRGRKTIKKKQLPELGLDGVDISKYATDLLKSGKHSETQWSDLNWEGLVRDLCSKVPNDEYPFMVLAKNQYDVLKYCDMVNPELDENYQLVMRLDTTYSPKFNSYCFKTGGVTPMKVHKAKNGKDIKASFKDSPFEEGDVVYIKQSKTTPRRQNLNGKWIPIPGEFEHWVKDYMVVR